MDVFYRFLVEDFIRFDEDVDRAGPRKEKKGSYRALASTEFSQETVISQGG
jgi:hypothetical protein